MPSNSDTTGFTNHTVENVQNIATQSESYNNNENFRLRLNTAVKNWMENSGIQTAILDSGATGNILTINAPIKNINPNVHQLRVTLLDGTNINTMVQGEIDWPHLPQQARGAYVIPKLTNDHSYP